MFKRLFFYACIVAAIIGLFASIGLIRRLRKVPPPPPPLAEPAKSPFPTQIGARGIVESIDENVRIAPAMAGLVTKVLVDVGDHVEKGDPLIEQDARDVRAMVEVKESEIAALQAQIDEAEISVADQQDRWNRVEKLSESRVASVDEKQRALFSLKSAQSRLATMRAQLEAAESELARAKVQVDLLTIRAPREGTILQVNVRAGEYAAINSPEPLLLLGQVDRLQLRADVDEDSASRVRPGAEAVAFIKGQRESAIPLKFVRIEPYIVPKKSLTGESSERVDTRVLQVIYQFDQPQLPVYVGQQMDVFIDASRDAGVKPSSSPEL